MWTIEEIKRLTNLDLRKEVAKLRGYQFSEQIESTRRKLVRYSIRVPLPVNNGDWVEYESYDQESLIIDYTEDVTGDVSKALQLVIECDFSLVCGYWNKLGEWEAEIIYNRNVFTEQIFVSRADTPARAICEAYLLYKQALDNSID